MGLAKNGHCLHTRITGVYMTLHPQCAQMVSHQWMDYGNLWITLITVTTSTISLSTQRLYIILNYQHNKSYFWTNTIYHSDEMIYQFIHTNRGHRCTNVHMLHELHTSVHGHTWIHTHYSSTYLSTRRCASFLSSCTGGGLGLVGKLFNWLAEDWKM